MKMGETDSADKFMVLVVEYFTYLFLLKQWEERGYELQIGQPQVIIKENVKIEES
jgi:predicted membrane GTPase involved in stress response